MDEPDHVKIARAVGRTLREEYAGILKELLPFQLVDLLLRLEQRSANPTPKTP